MCSTPANCPPNVLFVITDDHQASAIGAAGNTVVQTPVLDGLARRGVRFSAATHAGSLMPAICSPARACLLTGRDPFSSNSDPRVMTASDDFVQIDPALPTLPELFQNHGYATFFTGKWHNDREALLRSFCRARRIFHGGMCAHEAVPLRDREAFADEDTPEVGEGFSTELFCEAMIDFLNDRDQQKPFFAWLSLTSPHDPRTPPAADRARYHAADIPLPSAFRSEPAFDNGELEVRDEKLAEKPLTPAAVRQHVADYYGMISHQDTQIGRVLDALEKTGAVDEMIVVYIGDHGLSLGSHGLLGKQNLYEPSTRVPFILAGPGIPRDQNRTDLVYSLDVFATLLGLTGIEPPPGGASLDLLSSDHQSRTELFSVYKDCQRMVKESRWKLIEYLVDGVSRVELFDLESDPHEEVNRAGERGTEAEVARLRQKLATWQERVGDVAMPIDLSIAAEPVGS